MDEDQSLPDDGKDEIKEVKGEIEFDDVRFSYVEGSEVLKGVSFHAKPGETIAIVGVTGAGKSTIINLLSRCYDIDWCDINIDGQSSYSLIMINLRRRLG